VSLRGRWIAAALGLTVVFAALVLPPIALGLGGTSEASDQRKFHRPTIEKLAAELPRPDLVNLRTATAPGYHLAMAVVARGGLDGERELRAVSSLFSLAMLLVAWAVAARRAGPGSGLVLVAPVLLSSYVLGAATWLTTDNVALLLVLPAIAAGLSPAGPRRLAAGGLAAAGSVCVRQIHVWTAIVPWIGAAMAIAADTAAGRRWLGPGPATDPDVRPWSTWSTRERAAVLMAGLLPLAVVGMLVAAWGGLVPPPLADYHERGIRFAQPVLTLALLGGFGVFFVPVLVGRGTLAARGPVVVGVVAALLALVPATSYDPEGGRWGGAIWELVRRLPAPGDRSLVLAALAGLGAWTAMHAWRRLRGVGHTADAVVLLVTLAGWTAAHCLNAQTWQRYAEPLLLVWLAWACAIVLRADPDAGGGSRRWWIGPAVLSLIQLGLLSVTLLRPMLAD
jgi:hypothetical protein